MTKPQLILVAVVPALMVGALLISVIALRERAEVGNRNEQLAQAQRQIDEMGRLRDALTAARQDAKEARERWETDTRALGDDLGKANAALTQSVQQQERARQAIDDLTKSLAEINAKLREMDDKTAPAPKP